MLKGKFLFFLVFVLCAEILFARPVQSSQIKEVQAGTVYFGEGDSRRLLSLSYPVDTRYSFVLQSCEGSFFTSFLSDSSNLDISRHPGSNQDSLAAGSAVGYVVEYRDGIRVFRGIASIDPDVYTKDILLPATIDTQKAFPLISARGDIAKENQTHTQFFRATFPDSDTLRLQRLGLPFAADSSIDVAWQVVEIQSDVIVKSGKASIAHNVSRAVVNLSTEPISNPEKAFLIFNYTAGAGINGLPGLLMTRGTIMDGNTLIFNRAAIGSSKDQNIEISWYVIEFTDSASNVQKGKTALPAGFSTLNLALRHAVDTRRSFSIISTSGGEGNAAVLGSDLVKAEISKTIAGGDTITLSRRAQTTAVDVDWFVVELAPLTVTAPDSGENWRVSAAENILWSHAASLETGGSSPKSSHLLNILLSQDAGFSFPLIIAQGIDAASGFYAWTIPPTIQRANIIGDKLRIRLLDRDSADFNYDDSSGNFTIRGIIDLAVPIGGEVWHAGDTNREIVWHKRGDLSYSSFSIRLSENGGLTYDGVIADGLSEQSVCTVDRCSWIWPQVPDKLGLDRQIKVYLASDPKNVLDTSDADFYIKGKLQITSPNAGEEWETNTTRRITWNKWGDFNRVTLLYSLDAGASFDDVIARAVPAGGTQGFFDWDIPVDAKTDSARIKIISEQNEGLRVEDTSDADFRISRPALKVIYPDAPNEIWYAGDEQEIAWEVEGEIDKVHCWYVKQDEQPVRITPLGGVDADQGGGRGEFSWTNIPDEAVGDNIRIMVARFADNRSPGSLSDSSDNPLSIKGKLKIVSPNGKESFTVGSTQIIHWQTQGLMGNVRIRFAGNGADFDTVITPEPEGIPASREQYVWSLIPDESTDKGKIRIELISDPSGVFDESDDYFSIKGILILILPQGGEIFYIGDNIGITWRSVGTIGNLALYYSLDSGQTYPDSGLISGAVAQDAVPFTWEVPERISKQVRVKIAAVSDAEISVASEEDFQIKGKLHLIAPNGGEEWLAGTREDIRWERLGEGMGKVKLEYSVDNGSDKYRNLIATNIASSELSFPWQVPGATGSRLKVKITLLDDPETFDVSDNVFTIKGKFILPGPESGKVWYVGTQENIAWTTYGEIDKVNLYYSADAGLTYPITIAEGVSNVDGYLHKVPDAVTRQARIKVESFYDNSIFATSPENFIVRGRLTAVTPKAGEVLRVGETGNISWAAYGDIGNLEIRYSTDGGVSYPSNQVITPYSGVTSSAGTYAWTVPDAIGDNFKLKITSLSDNLVEDESEIFRIQGIVQLTAPRPDESLYVGDKINITWEKTGTLGKLELRYSTDGGLDYPDKNVIVTGAQAEAGSYSWTVPDAIGDNVRVKLLLLSNPEEVQDALDADLSIRGKLELSSPNGGESWGVATLQDITWKRTGSIANVKLDYSTDAGKSFPYTIADFVSAASQGFAWTVPQEVSDTVRIRIADTSDTSVYDISDNDFAIRARIDITSPDGGEVWIAGSTHKISWDTIGTISAVSIDYSTNSGGAFSNNIATAVSNSGSFSWTVPDAVSSRMRVRVSDHSNPDAFGISEADFKIRGGISVISPNGAEAWIVGTSHDITWSIVGSIADVRLEYSTDDGLSYSQIIASRVEAGAGGYRWVVPDTLSKTCRVKIIDISDATVYDVSDNNFKIRGNLTLISPNGKEQWAVGSTQDIAWASTGSIENARLEYSVDGGLSFPYTIVDSVDAGSQAKAGNYSWVVDDRITNQARVRISDLSDVAVYDVSDSDFKISGDLALTSPEGGEVWTVGSKQSITWSTAGSIAAVKLAYSTDGGLTYPYVISESTDAYSGTYSWKIPDKISSKIRVKIADCSDSSVFDTSDNNLKIIGKLVLSAPNGGEVWPVGSSQAIRWQSTGSIEKIKLEYSKDGGLTYPYLIADSQAAGSGLYNWVVPDLISSMIRVRITDTSDSVVYDTSEDNFKIRGALILSAPHGGEVWAIDSLQDITWVRLGSISKIRLEYSTDAGISYPYIIADSVDARPRKYSWTVPDNPSLAARVKISDAADITVYDASKDNFIIRAAFTITAPAKGASWPVGSIQEINWDTRGSVGNVKLEYSSDNGAHWDIIAGPVPNTGVYQWVIPDTISDECLVRISDVNDQEARNTSDGLFNICGLLKLTAPNGGEIWQCGLPQDITWTKTGSIVNLRLEYSIDGGLTYPYLIADRQAADAFRFSWITPAVISNQVKVKISDSDDPAVFDTSDKEFRIRGALDLITPNAGEIFIVGDSANIIWNTQGAIEKVKLEYSVDGGSGWRLIAGAVANTGSYVWDIPDSISALCRVRVCDANDLEAADTSDGNFQIRGDLRITAPNGGEGWIMGNAEVISWEGTGSIANVKLEYSVDGGLTFEQIIESAPNAGSYRWVVPDAVTRQAVVRIIDANDPGVFDISDDLFKIRGSLTVTSPNGGEAWLAGDKQNIAWDYQGDILFVKLEYSADGGQTYIPVEDGLSNTGLYLWQVPYSAEATARVKVSDTNDPEVFDISDADFRIRCSFNLISPNAGEEFRVGREYRIIWTHSAELPGVRLECSRDNFLADIKTIALNAPADQPYLWTVPDMIFDKVRVRVSDPDDPGAYDDSDNDFRIIGDFALISPDGGEVWLSAETRYITWDWAGSITQVKIEYSLDGGKTFSIIGAVDNTGSYPWKVPDTASTGFKVRVSDLVDPTAFDISDGNAEISRGLE
ncbi:hypothetical protein ACFL1D_04825 [Candidatus Omnitrophota bacterium]